MTTSDLALLKTLNLTDLVAIQDALQARVRATQKLIHEHIEPNKVKYPTLYSSYQKQLLAESDRLARFNKILSQL